MFKPGRWKSDKNKIKAVFRLQFHATQRRPTGSIFWMLDTRSWCGDGAQLHITCLLKCHKKKRNLFDMVPHPFEAMKSWSSFMKHTVLWTSEFWDCKAKNEIRRRMKLVMDFYKQMQIEGNKRGKSEKAACRPPSPERNQGKEHFNGLRQEGTQEENHKVKQVLEETAPPISSQKKLEDGGYRVRILWVDQFLDLTLLLL